MKSGAEALVNSTAPIQAFVARMLAGKPRVHVLMYHGILASKSQIGSIAVTRDEFVHQMEFLLKRFDFLHPVEFLQETPDRKRHALVLTFDDGFGNNATNAYPALKRLGIPALFFVSTRHLEERKYLWFAHAFALFHLWPERQIELLNESFDLSTTQKRNEEFARFDGVVRSSRISDVYAALDRYPVGSFVERDIVEHELRGMSLEETRRIAAEGLVTIGSHTRSHPYLNSCSDELLFDELQGSREELASITKLPVEYFAYPDGQYDARVLRAVQNAGYRIAFAVRPGEVQDSRLAIPRVGIYRHSLGVLAGKSYGLIH